MTLPGAPFVARRGDALELDGHDLAELGRRHGTPLFVYSARAMRSALAAYVEALQGREHLVCYAMKANSSLAVLQLFARAGCGFDIVSGGELERVLAAGGTASKVVFSGVGKTRAEMARALRAGVRCFNVESEDELETLNEVALALALRAPVSLRVNPDVDARTHPYISTGLKDNKFGIAHARALAAYRRAATLPGLRVVGIDCHIGSQITQVGPYVEALDRLLDLVEAVELEGIPLHHVDVGGGLGITYADEEPPPAGTLVRALLQRLDERGHGARELLFEPGRSLVGNAGVLVTEVLVLKPGAEHGGRDYCIVDAAMNDLVRPAMYEAWMAIEPCRRRADATRRWDIVGPVCESGDWLGRERELALRRGDLLAVLSAGAYGMSMSSNYNSRPRAAEVMVDGERAELIREREALPELYARERLLDT
ncbi:MAG: diaminopimelate decarboxylase [Burkholderiales bacterium]|nr:diaminopimelate decarboxylase [Burkholderiales bacterium]MDE1927774.1 diaminopimelate decarboxylase [Burkholderiales bacterium]MDE2160257.1 diaminopimelate decarboxylase [Burkholderiales bacterium]MDE2504038.1 diaminopimelate decarboxylase [Burkholderiales bacterium]